MSIDFNLIKPKYISFEHMHMSGFKNKGYYRHKISGG